MRRSSADAYMRDLMVASVPPTLPALLKRSLVLEP
jgi:hypothetical protein